MTLKMKELNQCTQIYNTCAGCICTLKRVQQIGTQQDGNAETLPNVYSGTSMKSDTVGNYNELTLINYN